MHISERAAHPHVESPWRAFGTAAWLGWQIESNWTRPGVFAVYAIVKPLSTAGILVLMFAAINRGGFASPAFVYMYLGNAFYLYVGAVMSGIGWAVVQDREHYRMLKSMYVAPMDIRLYLIGRGAARFIIASISVCITLAVGMIVFGLPIDLLQVNWAWFLFVLLLGLVSLASMGLAMAGLLLLSGNESWGLGELLAGALYLFSGAIFPLDVMPAALRPIGLVLPATYWLELLRRSLVDATAGVSLIFRGRSDESLAIMLALLTAAWGCAALLVFRRCERTARQRGYIDRTSNY
jgi:ABC-2 type transport system permease protein